MEIKDLDYGKLGLRIRETRKSRGLTQERLSEMVGISPNYLSRVETNNGGVVSLPALLRICNALGVGMDYMLVDSLAVRQDDVLSLGALSENDAQFMQVIVREFVRYKTDLLLTMQK